MLNVAIELWGALSCVMGLASVLPLTRAHRRYRSLLLAMFASELVLVGGDAVAGIFRGQDGALAWAGTHVGNFCGFAGGFALMGLLIYYLPGMSGVELARRLKVLNPRVNVVFATGYGDYMADAFELHSSGYLMKPVTAGDVARELENLRFPAWSAPEGREGKLYLQCFGNFEAFADGRPVEFGRAKSKELLAYLVDRRGAVVTLREAEAVIWGEDAPGRPSGSYLRTLVYDLRHSLAACGHERALVRRRGSLGVDVTQVSCDYYSFLEGDPLALNSWRGEYMNQYSWAETTKAALLRQAL